MRALAIVALTFLLIGGFWVFSLFRPGADARALRDSALSALQDAEHKMTLHANWLTMGLARAAFGLIVPDPEPRAMVAAIQSADITIYAHDWESLAGRIDVLERADQTMQERGWVRVVGALEGTQLVAIYLPQESRSKTTTGCCLLVVNKHNLIVASAQADPRALISLAQTRVTQELPKRKTVASTNL
jgi:hypothetical protein